MKRDKNGCDLQSCSLCRGCLKDWLPALDSHRQTFVFKRGQVIFEEGQDVNGIFFLVSGIAKVHKKWDDDKELIIRFAGPGQILGHRGLGKKNIFPVSATAIEPVTACFIPLDFFMSTLKINHEYAFQLLLFYAEELQESEKNMRNMAHMPVKGRIAQVLLKLKDQFGTGKGKSLNIVLSKQEIASCAGTTYETAFRMLNELARENLIELNGKGIVISNEKLLAKISG